MNLLTDLLALLEKIPGTFWGVIIGAFFSLSGVILTNRAHDRNLQAQLAHDRILKNREREMSLRKDVYLAAAEAVSAGLFAVSRFANLEIPPEKLTEGYLDKAPSIAKIHVIAKETTARAVVNFSAELSATFLRLFTRRLPLLQQKQQIDFLNSQIDTCNREQSRLLELQKQYNLDGLRDQHRWDVLHHNFEFEAERLNRTIQERDALAATLYSNQLQYMEECVAETVKLSRLLVPVIISVRKELELPIDETEYRKLMEEANAKQAESLREFVQQLQSLIAAQRAAASDAE